MSPEPVHIPIPGLVPVVEILSQTTALTLATIDDDGSPRATPLFFATDDRLWLYFLSEAGTQHARNLLRDAHAAAALFPPASDWREIRGLQIKGNVSRIEQGERKEALAIYADRFPFVADLAGTIDLSEVFRLTPSWIRLIDNRRGFGFKQDWRLPWPGVR